MRAHVVSNSNCGPDPGAAAFTGGVSDLVLPSLTGTLVSSVTEVVDDGTSILLHVISISYLYMPHIKLK